VIEQIDCACDFGLHGVLHSVCVCCLVRVCFEIVKSRIDAVNIAFR
jgi:hypothetical protein